jgi:hypothetical protein
MAGLTTKCPTGCGRPVDTGKLMCASCWSKVPRNLQQKVYSTWRALRRAPADERRGARYDYDTARDTALASIR